jgi:predicted porin
VPADGLTKMIGGGMSQSRWGLNVEEDLGGGSKALAHVEHRFNADTGEKDATAPFFQLSYVGLQGPYGKLTMGRQWNVLFDVVTSTYASFPYSPYMDAYKPELGMAAGARSSNSLKYTLATPSRNWVGTLQYSFAEGNNTDALVRVRKRPVRHGKPLCRATLRQRRQQQPQRECRCRNILPRR